ncbi:recombinase family protein [Corynebacterium resistens]
MDKRTDVSLPLDIPEQSEAITGEKVGYARVSTKDQNLDRQIALLHEAGAFSIYTDRLTGSVRHRPGLDEALRYVRANDQLIVASMDRLARSLPDLHSIVDDLTTRGVSVKFLKEGQTYSKNSIPVANLMLGLLGSVAEFERAIIHERQAEGIAEAKKCGVYAGQLKALTQQQVDQAKAWIADGIPKAEIARRLGVGRTTLYEHLNHRKPRKPRREPLE